MDALMIRIALLLFAFFGVSAAVQVTLDSPCSKLCLNDADISSISGSDISCNDADYLKAPGQKFQKCIECLQTSSFGTDDENDQGWFIYNLRFAADWCMFAADNAQKISGPCMDSVTCGGLESPLDVGNGDPTNSTTFDYCDKDGSAFSSNAAACNDCVQLMPGSKYLSNWVVALQAGCAQRPSQTTLIGLTGPIFDTDIVTISAPLSADDPTLKDKNDNAKLSTQAIIGIVVGVVVVMLILIGIVGWKCYKRRKARKLDAESSRWYSGLSTSDIPAPLDGAYSEYKPEPAVEVAPWGEDYVLKEMRSESRTREHTTISSASEGSSERSNPDEGHARSDSGLGIMMANVPLQEALPPLEQQPAQQAQVEPALQPRVVYPEPERNSTPVNPLRMNSYTVPSSGRTELGVSFVDAGAAVTLLLPAPQETPNPPQHTPSPLRAQLQARSTRSPHIPPPLNLQNAHAYTSSSHVQPSPRPAYASSLISSTSTTFSPGIYHTPPPSYQSPVRATFQQQSSQQSQPQHRPTVPLPTYNPADYAPKPANHYPALQPQFNTQQRFHSPAPAQPSRLAFHRPQPSVASTSSRFSFAASHTPSQPPSFYAPQAKHKVVAKQKDNVVPIIALPIPPPKGQTVDLRALVGMHLKQHISPDRDDVPAMPNFGGQEVEMPKGLDRTESLLAKSSPPFMSLARNLNPEAEMTLPAAEKAAPPGLDEAMMQVQRSDSQASYRGRSVSRPKLESLPHTHGLERDRSGSQVRYRSSSRDVDLEGGDGRKKKAVGFGFRGQDKRDGNLPNSAVEGKSPQSGAATDVEMWPRKMC